MRNAIRKEVAKRYVFTEDHRDRVRRLQVYKACAAAAKAQLNNEFARHVAYVCAEGGAVPITPKNRHMFSGMKEREQEWAPAADRSPQALGKLRRAYYARLAKEGLGAATGDGEIHAMRRLESFDAVRAEINGAFFDKAQADYWRRKKELEIWGLYALEGISVRDICLRLDVKRTAVHKVVVRMRQGMGGHSWDGKETDHAQDVDEELDDSGGP